MVEFKKNTGKTTWKDGSGEETTAEKVITFQRAMTKKVVSLTPTIVTSLQKVVLLSCSTNNGLYTGEKNNKHNVYICLICNLALSCKHAKI